MGVNALVLAACLSLFGREISASVVGIVGIVFFLAIAVILVNVFREK